MNSAGAMRTGAGADTMHYRELKEQAYEANREIPRQHLALYTWGNVSAFDPDRGVPNCMPVMPE
jgi:ribulose-5-phosphate 4-epimerase/fuculose-1-phosphate aldolase